MARDIPRCNSLSLFSTHHIILAWRSESTLWPVIRWRKAHMTTVVIVEIESFSNLRYTYLLFAWDFMWPLLKGREAHAQGFKFIDTLANRSQSFSHHSTENIVSFLLSWFKLSQFRLFFTLSIRRSVVLQAESDS